MSLENVQNSEIAGLEHYIEQLEKKCYGIPWKCTKGYGNHAAKHPKNSKLFETGYNLVIRLF